MWAVVGMRAIHEGDNFGVQTWPGLPCPALSCPALPCPAGVVYVLSVPGVCLDLPRRLFSAVRMRN